MNEEKKPQHNFNDWVTWTDRDIDPRVFYVSIPLQALTDNSIGTAMARGVMDEIKQKILQLIVLKRKKKFEDKNKIIIPKAVSPVPNSLKVH